MRVNPLAYKYADLNRNLRASLDDKSTHEANIAHYRTEMLDYLGKYQRALDPWRIKDYWEQAVKNRENALRYAKFFRLPVGKLEKLPTEMEMETKVANRKAKMGYDVQWEIEVK